MKEGRLLTMIKKGLETKSDDPGHLDVYFLTGNYEKGGCGPFFKTALEKLRVDSDINAAESFQQAGSTGSIKDTVRAHLSLSRASLALPAPLSLCPRYSLMHAASLSLSLYRRQRTWPCA